MNNWKTLSADSMPIAGEPVLLKIKEHKITRAEGMISAVHRYVVAVLHTVDDGFGKAHPLHFRTLHITNDCAPFFGSTVLFPVIEAWAAIRS